MKAEFEKTMLIVSELLSYCHQRGAVDYHFDVKQASSETTFEIKASPATLSDEKYDLLKRKLNAPRQREIEQDFWHLSGDSETTSELVLVGRMTDSANIDYDGETLHIVLKRKIE